MYELFQADNLKLHEMEAHLQLLTTKIWFKIQHICFHIPQKIILLLNESSKNEKV